MKLLYLSFWITEDLGYSDNKLPGAINRLAGVEVFHASGRGNVYCFHKNYDSLFLKHYGPKMRSEKNERNFEIPLTSLDYINFFGWRWAKGLRRLIKEQNPEIIQLGEFDNAFTVQVCLMKLLRIHNCKIIAECHTHESVFSSRSLKVRFCRFFKKLIIWPLSRQAIDYCCPITPDAAEICRREYNIPQAAIRMIPLGIDLRNFKIPTKKQKMSLRKRLEINEEIVGIYTGQVSEIKKVDLVIKAVNNLANKGVSIRLLLIGPVSQTLATAVQSSASCVSVGFVKHSLLAEYYKAADFGVWPTQESLNQLDALASGLPLILSDECGAQERLGDIGKIYKEGSHDSLEAAIVDMILNLKNDPKAPHKARKLIEKNSWDCIAERYADLYR